MSLKISLLVKLISFFCLLLNICSISCYSCNLPKDDITTMEKEVNLIEDKEDLKSQFKPLLDNLFLNRNSSILSNDSEGLKSFYNLEYPGPHVNEFLFHDHKGLLPPHIQSSLHKFR